MKKGAPPQQRSSQPEPEQQLASRPRLLSAAELDHPPAHGSCWITVGWQRFTITASTRFLPTGRPHRELV
jgi:hypothetical protein